MKFPKYYIGPMSKNVVDSVIKHSHKHLIGFIPSRRQIDFSGGYVNHWNTATFIKYVRSKKSKAIICRDHGGELQGAEKDDGYDSFLSDIKYFDLIHIDPFRVCKSMKDAALQTIKIIQNLSRENPNIMYEVGTEEAIFKYEPNELNHFLDTLSNSLSKKQFKQIKYAVVQSGTGLDLSTRTNIGNFSRKRLNKFIKVVKNYGLMSKEHNGDYLIDSFDVEMRFETGLDAINIAPEFGQIESEYYLERCRNNSDLFETLYQICYNSGKWKKWVQDVNRISKEQLIMTSCHYILSNKKFLQNIKIHFPNADKIIKKRIKSQLKLLYEQTKNYCV